jgi:hypothetical protein
MASGYPFGIFKLLSIALSILQSTVPDYPLVSSNLCPLHCLSFNLRFLITLWCLQTFVHCIVYPSIYGSVLPFGIFKPLSIALSILQSTVPDYPLVSTDFCPLHCLSFNLRFLITLWYLQTFVHCIVYPSIYGSWLPFGIYRLLSLSILQSTVPDYPLVSIDFYYCQMDSGNSSNISTLHIIAPQRLIKKTVSVFNQIIIQCCEYLFRYGIIRF